MSSDGPRNLQHRRRAPHDSLIPVAAARAPLSAGFQAISGSPVGSQVARLEDELAMARKALRTQRAENRVEKQQNERLTSELQALRHELERTRRGESSLETASDFGQPNIESLENRHRIDVERLRAEYESRVRELEAKCARDIALLEEKHAAKQSALRNSLSAAEELTLAKSERIRRLLARLNRVHTEGAQLRSIAPPADVLEDLTVLRGIGPVYALALRREGVHSVTQLAHLTEEEVRAIAPKIGTTAARIFRESWVEQARKLLR